MSLFVWFLSLLLLSQFTNFNRFATARNNNDNDDYNEPPEHFDYEIDLNSILIGLLIGFGTFLLFCSIVSRVFSKRVVAVTAERPAASTMRSPLSYTSHDQRRNHVRPPQPKFNRYEPSNRRQQQHHQHQHRQQHPASFDFRQQHQRTFSAPVSTATTNSTTSSSFGSTNSSYIQKMLRNLNAMITTATATTKTNATLSGSEPVQQQQQQQQQLTPPPTPPPVFYDHVKETKIDYCCQFDVNEKHVCTTSDSSRNEGGGGGGVTAQNSPSKPAIATSAKTIADIAAAAAAAAATSQATTPAYSQSQQYTTTAPKQPYRSIVYDTDHKQSILVEIALQYVSRLKELSIQIVQALNVPAKAPAAATTATVQTQKPATTSPKFRQLPQSQIKVTVWSAKKIEYKTKIREGASPQFLETFCVTKIEPEQVLLLSLQLRLYRYDDGTLLRKRTLLAQTVLPLRTLHFEIDNNLWLTLDYTAAVLTAASSSKWPPSITFAKKPPNSLTTSESCMSPFANRSILSSDSSSTLSRSSSEHSTQSLRQLTARTTTASTHQSNQRGQVPELLLGLAFNATTGALAVEIVKGSNFRHTVHDKSPDSYVKLTLLNSIGHEMGYGKTTVARHQSHPLFKQQFRFQVTLYQLTDVTLLLAVYNRRGRRQRHPKLSRPRYTKAATTPATPLHHQQSLGSQSAAAALANDSPSFGRRDMIGWLSFGLNSSGPEQFAHWMDMKDAAATSNHMQIARWHVLLLSPIVFAAETALAAAAIANCSDSDNA